PGHRWHRGRLLVAFRGRAVFAGDRRWTAGVAASARGSRRGDRAGAGATGTPNPDREQPSSAEHARGPTRKRAVDTAQAPAQALEGAPGQRGWLARVLSPAFSLARQRDGQRCWLSSRQPSDGGVRPI